MTKATIEVPLLDRAHINQLRGAIGSGRFDGLLGLLANELIERPATIRRHVLAGDIAGARSESHSLKGASTSVGAMALGQAAAAIELGRDLKTMRRALDFLDLQAARTRGAIESWLPRRRPARENR